MLRIRIGLSVEYPLERFWIGEQKLIPLKSSKDIEVRYQYETCIDRTCSKDSLEANDVPIEALPFKVS